MRRRYTKEDVKQLRRNRTKLMPKKDGVSFDAFQKSLGDLRAAGHLGLIGVNSISVERLLAEGGYDTVSYNVKYDVRVVAGAGEPAHFIGYLQSVHDNDKIEYKVKAWLNQDGTLRIELVV